MGAFTGGVDTNGVPSTTSGGQGITAAVTDNTDSTACCTVSVSGFSDNDSDGVADSCDLDNDNDGILDAVENDASCIITDVGSSSGDTIGSYLNDLGEIVNYTATSPASPYLAGNSCLAGGSRPNCAGEDYSSVTGATNVNIGRTFTVTFDRVVNEVTFIMGCMEDTESGDFVTNTAGSQSVTSNCPSETTIVNNSSVNTSVSHSSLSTVELTVYSIVGFTEVTYTVTSANHGTVNMKICPATDTDSDGIPDHLDLDSDNDGCYDALEAAGPYTYAQLTLGVLTGVVDANGIPSMTSGGQETTAAVIDSSDSTACCDVSVSGFSDNDLDGVADFCDLDDDNDGILDTIENSCTGSIQYEFYDDAPPGNTVDNISTTGALSTGSVTNFDLVALANSIPSDLDAFGVRYKGLIFISGCLSQD